MTPRTTIRPAEIRKPSHWSSAPPPAPCPVENAEPAGPTRYGDWVRKGIAVDF